MKVRTGITAAALTVCLTCANAQEKTIDRSNLPAAVEKTVAEQAKGATVKRVSTEMSYGKRTYEAEMLVDGHSKDIEVAADGALNEVEEEVAFDALSANVKTALTKKAAGARITKVESLTKKNKLVAYEAATLHGVRKGEVQVGPDGGALTHPE